MNPVTSWLPRFGHLLVLVPFAVASWAPLRGQAPTGFTPNGGVQPTAFEPDAGIVAARLEASRATQIRVTVHVLSLDDSTRTSMYDEIGPDAIKTHGTKIPVAVEKDNRKGAVSRIDSERRMATTSHVSSCILDQEGFNRVLTKVRDSPESVVVRTPSFILLDGLRAGYSDISQRPFVVDVEKGEVGMKPVVQVLEEGTRVRVHATLSEWEGQASQRIKLQSEISWHKIIGVETEQVYGIESSAVPIQVPTYMVKTAIAAEELQVGQTLMVDPYLTQRVAAAPTPPESLLSRLGYVGRNFKSPAPTSTQRHLVFLLKPTLQKMNP